MSRHYSPEHLRQMERVETYAEMFLIARSILENMPQPIVQVCGPIGTGGKGSIQENLDTIKRAVRWLENGGRNVFDQTLFEQPMARAKAKEKAGVYPVSILKDFYLPIFESGHVSEVHFLPDWESSTGARWEHEQAKRLGLSIVYLPKDWER